MKTLVRPALSAPFVIRLESTYKSGKVVQTSGATSLLTHAQALLDHKISAVHAGDYNAIPTDFDVYSPERWRDDALSRPKERLYWRNAYARHVGLRIDHLLVSLTLCRQLTKAGVDHEIRGLPNPSDHAPAWIELSDGKTRRTDPLLKHRRAKAEPRNELAVLMGLFPRR